MSSIKVQDWHRDDQSQRRVKSTVEEVLDHNLPDSYTRKLFAAKCDTIFNLFFTRANLS